MGEEGKDSGYLISCAIAFLPVAALRLSNLMQVFLLLGLGQTLYCSLGPVLREPGARWQSCGAATCSDMGYPTFRINAVTGCH